MRSGPRLSELSLLAVACFGVALRALVPSGFMAAPLSRGWPIKACPAQGGAIFLEVASTAHGDHHGDDEPRPGTDSEEQSCPPAAFYSAQPAPCPVAMEFELVEVDALRPARSLLRGVWNAGIGGARGPPRASLPPT